MIEDVRKAGKWRGKPDATKYSEFYRLMKVLRPTKNDVFYDLGCGDGNTCRWISKKVKLAVGIEDFGRRYEEAVKETRKYMNVKILKKDFNKVGLRDATIVYTLMALSITMYRRINRIKHRVTLVEYDYPIYPMKSKVTGQYFISTTPFKRVKDENEFAQIFTGNRNSTIKDVYRRIGRKETKNLKWYISRADSNWKKLTGRN